MRVGLCSAVALLALAADAARAADGVALAPDARGVVAPDRAFDMAHLQLEITLRPADRALDGVATWTARRIGDGPLVLDAVALDVDSVESAGARLAHRYDGRRIEIDLPGVAPGAETSVAIRYRATPRRGIHFREVGSDRYAEAWSHGEASDNRYWFPGWDHPNDRFRYDGVVHAPPGWVAVTNSGVDLVNYLVMLAAGPYEEIGAAPFTALVARGTPRAEVEATLAPVAAMAQHFQSRTGRAYPWNRYRQIFVQRFLFTGMENTAATIMARWVLRDEAHAATRGLRAENVTAHELAHQWFGDWLTCRDWRELWLNEGFATFMADDWMAAAHGPWQAASDARRRRASALAEESLAGRFFRPGKGDHHNVYEKGSTVLRMLVDVLGEDRAWAGIRAYVARGPALVDTEDFRADMEAASGQELGWFFQQWVDLPTVPKLVVRARVEDGRTIVRVAQTVDATRPAYAMPIVLEASVAGVVVRRRAWLDDAELEFALDGLADWAAIDPDGRLLADIDTEQAPEAWERMLGASTPGVALAAAEALGKTDRSEALAGVLGDRGKHAALRRAAARALGAQRATDSLLPALADPDARVRESVIAALGEGTGTRAVQPLLAALAGEPNPDLRGAVLTALARLDPAEGVRAARRFVGAALEAEESLATAAADVIGDHGEAAEIAPLLSARTRGRVRAAAVRAAGRVVERMDAGTAERRARGEVSRAAEVLLDDLDERVRDGAVATLAKVGDARSVAALERFARVETRDADAAAARDAIAAIRARGPRQSTPNEDAAKLEALEKRIEALEKRLAEDGDRH